MADPRLDSIHLDSRRRDEFREAREHILNARGNETQFVERRHADLRGDQSGTLIQAKDVQVPIDFKYYIQDHEFVYPLKVGLNTIGRLPDNDIVINDAHVSRRHCAIVVHSREVCEVHDVASKNGTYLNGGRLNGPTRLKSGDEIRMSERLIMFHIRDLPFGAGRDESSDHTIG